VAPGRRWRAPARAVPAVARGRAERRGAEEVVHGRGAVIGPVKRGERVGEREE
jgi:hypothetical protein